MIRFNCDDIMLTIMVHALQMAFHIFWDRKMVLELVNFCLKDKEAQLWENHIVAIHEEANRFRDLLAPFWKID